MTTSYTVPDDPKMLRETLCVAQAAVAGIPTDTDRKNEHIGRIGRLIRECERHRPTGPNGKHGDQHTPTCGCEDVAMSSLSALEVADRRPREQDEKPCGNPACSLLYGHRGPCAPDGVRQTPVQRAARVLQPDGGRVVMLVTRKMLHAALDVYEIAHDLHTLHAQPGDGGACADCDFRAGYLIGRLTRDHP